MPTTSGAPHRSTVDSAFRALKEDRANEAERLCREAIDQGTGDARTWHLLGVSLAKQGRHADAVPAFEQAVALDATNLQYLSALAGTLKRFGRIEDAAKVYAQLLEIKPDDWTALMTLGEAAAGAGAFARASELFERATRVDPENAASWFHLAGAARRQGHPKAMIDAYRRAVELEPGNAQLKMAWGEALAQNDRWAEAAGVLTDAVRGDPSSAEAWRLLALCREKLGDLSGAVEAYKALVRIAPQMVNGYFRLGLAFDRAGDAESALDAYRRVLELDSTHADAAYNCGLIHESRRDFPVALTCYQRALAADSSHMDAALARIQALRLNGDMAASIVEAERFLSRHPRSAKAHFDKGLALLQLGRWAEAWPEYEWRCEEPGLMKRSGFHSFRRPKWQGQRLNGERVLIFCEQGLGDALQFIRYVPMVRQRGAQVLVECRHNLVALFRTSFPDVEVVQAQKGVDPGVDYDLYIPLMSLPGIFGTTPDTVPANVPYLAADPLRQGIPDEPGRGGRLKVGLVWAGNPKSAVDHLRSIGRERLGPLGEVEGVSFFGLQVGAARNSDAGHGVNLTDLGPRLHDFADTAAVMADLDLVVTVETAAAHLAGALGKPVWVLLPHVTDWRWMRDRPDSPWYPTMRLFRQPRPGDWAPVVDAVAAALREWVAKADAR